jgi:hypothetical protein
VAEEVVPLTNEITTASLSTNTILPFLLSHLPLPPSHWHPSSLHSVRFLLPRPTPRPTHTDLTLKPRTSLRLRHSPTSVLQRLLPSSALASAPLPLITLMTSLPHRPAAAEDSSAQLKSTKPPSSRKSELPLQRRSPLFSSQPLRPSSCRRRSKSKTRRRLTTTVSTLAAATARANGTGRNRTPALRRLGRAPPAMLSRTMLRLGSPSRGSLIGKGFRDFQSLRR